MTFKKWMECQGLSTASVNNYDTAIKGVISDWAQAADFLQGPINAVESHQRFAEVSAQIRELEVFKQRNSTGNGMYSAALNKFAAYLKSSCKQNIEDDLSEILNERDCTETDKITSVKTRLGQGIFRQKLIGYWQGCAVTQYPDTSLLVASHIKPWCESSNEERLNVYNGFLLLPTLDKAFDKGLVTFEENGKIKVSEQLEMPELLGISSDMKVRLDKQHQDYLAFHRDCVFRKAPY